MIRIINLRAVAGDNGDEIFKYDILPAVLAILKGKIFAGQQYNE